MTKREQATTDVTYRATLPMPRAGNETTLRLPSDMHVDDLAKLLCANGKRATFRLVPDDGN